MPDKYEFATEYILQECGSLHWWWLNKKWKRIAAARIARIIIDEALDAPNNASTRTGGDAPASEEVKPL